MRAAFEATAIVVRRAAVAVSLSEVDGASSGTRGLWRRAMPSIVTIISATAWCTVSRLPSSPNAA